MKTGNRAARAECLSPGKPDLLSCYGTSESRFPAKIPSVPPSSNPPCTICGENPSGPETPSSFAGLTEDEMEDQTEDESAG